MSTRRRAQTRTKDKSVLESNDEIEEEIEVEPKNKPIKRPKSTARKSKQRAAAAENTEEEGEEKISSVSSMRVTRSRSREPSAAPAPVMAPVSRRPRLDVQSEDEEETAVPELPEVSEVPEEALRPTWRKLSLEGRSLVVASLLLLLLLLVIHSLVSSLHSDNSLNDSVILGLAYVLTPVRVVLETVRFLIGPSHVHYSAENLDYDILLDNILSSDRFRLIVDKVSSDKLNSFELALKDQIVAEINSLNRPAEISQNFDEVMAQTRRGFSAELEKSMADIKQQLDFTVLEIKQDTKAKELDTQINQLKVKLEEIILKIESSQHQPDEKISAEVEVLKDKLRALEVNGEATAADIRKCCQDNSKIDLVTHNKVEEMMKQLKVTLEDKMISKTELDAKIAETEAKALDSLASYKHKIVEETKQEIESLMSSKVIDLQNNLEAEVVTVSSASVNVSEPSSKPGLDVKKIVREALTKYDADKTGLFDFALETAGGSILSTKCTEPYQVTTGVLSVWGIPFWWDTNSPRTILQPGTSPGQCWAFRGSQGSVLVQLSSSIHITAVSIEHISSLLSPDGNIYSAPSHMSLSGVRREEETVTTLLNFTYSATGEPVQTFWLPGPSEETWQLVELAVHNNHGHPDYTCLYRLRVHGNVNQDRVKEH